LEREESATEWWVRVAYEFRDPLLLDILDSIPADEAVDIVPMYVSDSAFTHEIARRAVAKWVDTRPDRPPDSVRVLPPLDRETLVDLNSAHILRALEDRRIDLGEGWALLLAAHGTLLDPPKAMETGRVATEALALGIIRQLAGHFDAIELGWLN